VTTQGLIVVQLFSSTLELYVQKKIK